MHARGVGSGREGRALRRPVPLGDGTPPGHEDAEHEVVAVRRPVEAGLRLHAPRDLGPRQRAARVVGRRDGNGRGAARDVRSLAGRGLHLELRPAELLDLEAVRVAGAGEGGARELELE